MDVRQHQEEQIRKRVACEEKAFHVVLRLLDNPITEDYLKDAGQLITLSHYADVVEERSIAKLCGYPVCGNNLGSVPKQRYRISTKSNTVYDITERKKFCSNYCLKASQYFEKQISTSPVWAREKDSKINFEFLTDTRSCSVGDAVFLPIPRTDLKKDLKQLEKLDKITSSDQKHASVRSTKEELPTTGYENPEDDKSNLLSDIVDRMAAVKLSYTGDVEGINVDFSEEKASGEPVVRDSGDEEIKGTREVTHKHDESENIATPQCSDETVTEPDGDAETDHGIAKGSDNSCETKDRVIDRRYDRSQESEASPFGKNVSKDVDCTSDSGTKGPMSGESKEDYVMRLLNRKKHLLGQLADIQQTEMTNSKARNLGNSFSVETLKSDVIDSDEDVEEDVTVSKTTQSKVVDQERIEDGEHTVENWNAIKPIIQEIFPQKNQEQFKKSQIASQSPKKNDTSKSSSNSPSVKVYPLNAVGKVMEEWVTRDSLRYLGVGRVDDSVTQPSDFEKNYAELCQKVLKEEKDFESLLGEESVDNDAAAATHPVPDYRKMESETRGNELRVREFYSGSTGGPGKKALGKTEKESLRTVKLPVVDSHDQMTIRRKIVLDRLDKVIPDLLTPLRLSIQDVSHHIRELVYTFSFSSENILFKPGEWSLVGILLMKMLSLKSKTIEASFKHQSALKYFSIILTAIGHRIEDLDEIVHVLACLNLQS